MNRAHDTSTRRGRDEGGSRGSAPAAMRHRSGRPATAALSATPPAQVGAEPHFVAGRHGVTRGGDVDRPSAGRHGYAGDSHAAGPVANPEPWAAAREGKRRRSVRRTRAG